LLPPESLVQGLPHVRLAAEPSWRFSQGQPIGLPEAEAGTEWALFSDAGRFLGVARAPSAGRLEPARVVSMAVSGKRPDFP
jgi:hypothetical protein